MSFNDTKKEFVDQDLYRNVIGHFASGVTVITARHEDTDYGLTANAVSSLSLDPPMMLVCINRETGTRNAISHSKVFAVNILREDQGEVAMQFARPNPDKFRGMSVSYGELREPLLDDVLAHLECRVAEEVTGGTHSVFLAEVHSARAGEGMPLTFYRGQMGRFEDAADEKVYGQLRQQVLTRELPPGEQIDADDLAYRLDAPRQSVYYAMTRLSGEDLVSRTSEGAYVINPLDAEGFGEALDARCMIEIGAAEQSIGDVSDEEVAELREKAEATVPYVEDGRFVDFERYMETNAAFHEYLVGLAKNDTLLASYRRLGVATTLLRTLHSYEAKDSMIRDHLGIAEAFEAADLEEAKRVIRRHAEDSKRHGQHAIESAGGRI